MGGVNAAAGKNAVDNGATAGAFPRDNLAPNSSQLRREREKASYFVRSHGEYNEMKVEKSTEDRKRLNCENLEKIKDD